MSLWGKTTDAADRPKFLPKDSNASGSMGARENAIATAGGWALSPGLAASGNDNPNAQPELLICLKNLATVFGSATVKSIDWTDGTVGNVGTFDITVTFDEAVDITSAAWSANQTITNKAYILLSRIGKTDMVEDSTMACMYYAGTGTNQLTFRGTAQTNAATGYLGFNGGAQGDTADNSVCIIFDGSSTAAEEDGNSVLSIRLESGTTGYDANVPSKLVLDTAADAGDEILAESIDFAVEGDDNATDITGIARTGEVAGGNILLEQGANDTGRDTLVQDTAANVNENFDLEDTTTAGIAVHTQAGSTSGSATLVLAGVDVAAA
jgi:hypothetical protein|tara:strand:+ start:1878 stop:2849 length:972 start_codon:yes stop_codon:yes gene_type:complete